MLSNLKSRKENREYVKSIINTRGKEQINWVNSVSKEIEYEYYWYGKCYKGVLKIRKYENKYVYFEGYEKGIETHNLIKGSLGGILSFKSSEFKYEIGATINCLTIIAIEKDKEDRKGKYYKYRCNKCGYEDWIREYDLNRGRGCSACCLYGGKAVYGSGRTILEVAPWMIDLGVTEEDAKNYTYGSDKKIYIECPDCGKTKKIRISDIYKSHSIGCSCGDGISYPEKLMESVLIQLNVEYERQYRIDLSQKKIYDFYLTDYNTIIETHGVQHYKESTRGRSLKEEQENDGFKKELALKNGIEHYIIIDCRQSTLNWVKNNILDSELNELFDLSNINWTQCEEYALKNKVREVCSYYKEHQGISTIDLAKEFSISRPTIIKYLKQGTKLGWCKYDAKEELRRGGKLNASLAHKAVSKLVSQFTLDGEFIKTYPSTMEAERQTGIKHSSISYCCRGKQKTAGGFIWKYAE